MYGDFSRLFDARSGQYSAVLAQQGRFLLDAELNEQTSIVLDYLRHLTTDLIGPFAGPAHRAGFGTEPIVEDKKLRAVKLSRGHYYVYGLRCEAPGPGGHEEDEVPLNEHEAPCVIYLVVWEQTVGAIQAPERVEPALGLNAPDTARRSQVRWSPQAAVSLPGTETDLTGLAPEKIVKAFHEHNTDPERRPMLGATATSRSTPDATPSTAPAGAAYRGIENQLYRVEVHRGGGGHDATFKWSRDNGSVELALDSLTDIDEEGHRTATLQTPWRDARGGLQVGEWVELVDDLWAPFGTPAPLMRVQGVSLAKREVTLEDGHQERWLETRLHPFLRRWDQDPDDPAARHGIPVAHAEGTWFELEDGVQVQFEPNGGLYQLGDFWLIPARTATRDVLWPASDDGQPGLLAVSPHGPARYRVPLALVKSLTEKPIDVTDLRAQFGQRLPEPEPEADDGDQPASAADISDLDVSTVIRPPKLNFRLRSVSSFAAGEVFDVHEGETRLGRGHTDGINFLQDEVSHDHAILIAKDKHLTIEDLRSRNGTFVNSKKISAVTELAPGNVIELGTDKVQLKVESVEAAQGPDSTPA